MGGGAGTGVVIDTGDLSREPGPPPYRRASRALELRKAGAATVEGEAFIRLRVGVDRVPSHWQVILEDPLGYELGQACIKRLEGEAWQAPLDANGRPVTTRVVYRCGYEIVF